MTTLDVSAKLLDIVISEGDTFAWTITLRDEESTANPKTPLTLDESDSYTLTVNSERNPADDTNEVFQLAGIVLTQTGDPDTNATEGQVQFSVSDANWTSLAAFIDAGTVEYVPEDSGEAFATFYAELRQVDVSASNAERRKGKGEFKVKQSIEKT